MLLFILPIDHRDVNIKLAQNANREVQQLLIQTDTVRPQFGHEMLALDYLAPDFVGIFDVETLFWGLDANLCFCIQSEPLMQKYPKLGFGFRIFAMIL